MGGEAQLGESGRGRARLYNRERAWLLWGENLQEKGEKQGTIVLTDKRGSLPRPKKRGRLAAPEMDGRFHSGKGGIN